jgi:hypothetical protein
MRNIGDEPARYLVFEWHGAPVETGRGGDAAPAPAVLAAV